MSTTTKRFSLGDVLSISTGRLLSRKRTSGRYALLRHLHGGDAVHSVQMGELLSLYHPLLLAHFPGLQAVDCRGVTAANYDEWLQAQEHVLGAWLDVPAMPTDVETPRARVPLRKTGPAPSARPALARMKTGRHAELVIGK